MHTIFWREINAHNLSRLDSNDHSSVIQVTKSMNKCYWNRKSFFFLNLKMQFYKQVPLLREHLAAVYPWWVSNNKILQMQGHTHVS